MSEPVLLREKTIHFVPDRHWKSEYFLMDQPADGDSPRIQILYCENRKARIRTVEAVNHGAADGWDCDVWASDVRVIIAKYLPPKISFNQFVGKLAIALELVPPDYAIGNATVPIDQEPVDNEDNDTTAWSGPLLRQLVAALPELKH